MLRVLICSSISSPGMMDLENEVLVAFRQSDHSSASAPRRCNFRGEKLYPLGRKHLCRGVVGRMIAGGAVLWRAPLELLGTVPDVCGDCSPLDTLLGFGKKLVEFRLAFLRCLVCLPLRAEGKDLLGILASDVPADFRQTSRSAFQPQVRSTP